MKYENAADVLPKELLKEVRKHFPGGLLFVPKTDRPRQEREKLVVKLIEKKVPVKAVAGLARISPRQVYRIVKKHRSEDGAT